MRLPTVQGTIKRRLLVNFRAEPGIVVAQLPSPFRPKLHHGHAIVGVCLIRLEQVRPIGLPAMMGISSENAAHRIAVEWTDESGSVRDGVYVPRRDTGSAFNRLAGGRLFPGEQHGARFDVTDTGHGIDFSMESFDREVRIRVVGEDAPYLPKDSCFRSLSESSEFFESGSVGYSATKDPSRLDGLRLETHEWEVCPLAVLEIETSYFDDERRFPRGSVVFDHALVMRDVAHEWHAERELSTEPRACFSVA